MTKWSEFESNRKRNKTSKKQYKTPSTILPPGSKKELLVMIAGSLALQLSNTEKHVFMAWAHTLASVTLAEVTCKTEKWLRSWQSWTNGSPVNYFTSLLFFWLHALPHKYPGNHAKKEVEVFRKALMEYGWQMVVTEPFTKPWFLVAGLWSICHGMPSGEWVGLSKVRTVFIH